MLLCRCQGERGGIPARFVCIWFMLAIAFVGLPKAWGQPIVPRVPAQPSKPVYGPATVDLGTIAELDLPAGYKFLNAGAARDELIKVNNMVSPNLLGMIVPENFGRNTDRRGIIITFAPIGFVKVGPNESLDPEKALVSQREHVMTQNRMLSSAQQPTYEIVEWHEQPVFDASNKKLEFAIRAENTKSETVYNHNLKLLGRRGMLGVTCMLTAKDEESFSELRNVLNGLRFKKGEAYADFAEGDTLSSFTLAGVLESDNDYLANSELSAPVEQSSRALLYWLIGVACLVAVGSALFVIKLRHARSAAPVRELASSKHVSSTNSITTFVPAHLGDEQKPVASAETVRATPQSQKRAPLVLSPKPIEQTATRKPARTNGHHGRNDKKRLFDYNRYFADLMSSVSGHLAYEEGRRLIAANNGDMATNGNGGSGHSGAITHAPLNTADIQAQVIATQKSLLEEQRRLIQEQSKIIEEKTRLIAEKNRILERQADLFDEKLL